MALDLCILDSKDEILESLPITDEMHEKLILSAKRDISASMIARLSEYYEDASFSSDETGPLNTEVEKLLRRDIDADLRNWLIKFGSLIEKAKSLQLGVHAIAD